MEKGETVKKSKAILRFIGFSLLGAFVIAGCGTKEKELVIFADASFSSAFNIFKARYEKDHKHIRLNITYGPSGRLAGLIENGAAVDLFASTGQPEMDRLEEIGLIIPESRMDFAGNELCLISISGTLLTKWEALTSPEVEFIGIAGPTTPLGRATLSLLEKRNLLDDVSEKFLVRNDIEQLWALYFDNRVKAAIVYNSDADYHNKRGDVVLSQATVEPDDYPPILHPIAVVKSGSFPGEAQGFITYILSPKGQNILMKKGYNPIFIAELTHLPDGTP